MTLVGIIILNYNGNQDTIECLQSLEKWLPSPDLNFRIFLVDNASKKPLLNADIDHFKLDIIYIQNSTNYGFAEGNNIGILRAIEDGCDFVILLNNDTVLIDRSLQRVIEYMRSHCKIGIGGLVNYYYDDSEAVWQAGFNADLVRGVNEPVSNDFRSSGEFCFVDYVPGSAFIIRKEVIHKIGVLESDCFAYYEDIDYCIRAKQAAFEVGFDPRSQILHKVGRSSVGYIKEYLRTRNKLAFYNKYSRKRDFKVIYLNTILRSVKRVLFNKGNRIKLLKSHVLAFWDFHHNVFKEGSIKKLK